MYKEQMERTRWIECWVPYWLHGHFSKYRILFNPSFVKHYFYKKGEVETMDGHRYEIVKENGKIVWKYIYIK